MDDFIRGGMGAYHPVNRLIRSAPSCFLRTSPSGGRLHSIYDSQIYVI